MATLPSTSASTTAASPAPDWSAMIVHTPGVCSGEARIDGTRIKVKHVFVWVEEMGMTPSQVIEEYPHLTRAQVHAALAYYWSHQEEVRADIEAEDRLVAELKAKLGPSKLQARLAEAAEHDSAFVAALRESADQEQAEEDRLQRALDEAKRLAKEQVRREMGLD